MIENEEFFEQKTLIGDDTVEDFTELFNTYWSNTLWKWLTTTLIINIIIINMTIDLSSVKKVLALLGDECLSGLC